MKLSSNYITGAPKSPSSVPHLELANKASTGVSGDTKQNDKREVKEKIRARKDE